jgi:hypothetical protein
MKNVLIRVSWAFAIALALGAPAAAQIQDNTTYGGTAAEFLLLGAGARGTALGGAYAALTTDVTALYYNPGGLAQMTRPGAMVSTYTYIAGTRYTWAGVAFPISGGSRAVGVSIGTFGFSNAPVYTLDNPEGDGSTYSVSETFLAGTYSQNFSDRFSAGFSAKFISDKLGQTSAQAVAIDFGTNFHATVGARPIRGAFIIENLGSNLQHTGSGLDQVVVRQPPLGTVNVPQEPQPASLKASSWSLPVLFRVSVALDLVNQAQNRITLLSEFTQPNNNKPGAGAGLEYALTGIGTTGFSLAARGSYTIQPANNLDAGSAAGFTSKYSASSLTSYGVAVGGGIGYHRGNVQLGFDYAYKNLGPLGGTDYFSFSLGW